MPNCGKKKQHIEAHNLCRLDKINHIIANASPPRSRVNIISGSALESCVKLDYINNVAPNPDEGEKYVREVSVHKLLNKYFNVKDIGRLLKQYKDFSNIHIKIRNSLVHPEEFEFSESTAEYALRLITELIKYLESKQ